MANRNGPTRIWVNDGTGRFRDSGQRLGSAYNVSVALGDLDGDGDPDLVIGKGLIGAPQPAEVWINDGHGVFTDSDQRLGNSNSFAIALADFDNDGALDLFLGNFSGPSTFWTNNGHGRFTKLDQEIDPMQVIRAAVADLNCDGHPDLWIGCGGNRPDVIFGAMNAGTSPKESSAWAHTIQRMLHWAI